ncbi:hypothetical protein D3C85_1438110 [compost metagenome]
MKTKAIHRNSAAANSPNVLPDTHPQVWASDKAISSAVKPVPYVNTPSQSVFVFPLDLSSFRITIPATKPTMPIGTTA